LFSDKEAVAKSVSHPGRKAVMKDSRSSTSHLKHNIAIFGLSTKSFAPLYTSIRYLLCTNSGIGRSLDPLNRLPLLSNLPYALSKPRKKTWREQSILAIQ